MIVVDDARMRAMHAACFGTAAVTDTLALAYPPFPPGAAGWRGEVVVNAERACRRRRLRGSPARELALYLAHGFDHLDGADDATPAARERMRRRENRWLRGARERALTDRLVPEDPRRHA